MERVRSGVVKHNGSHSNSADTVTVACRHINGLILRVCKMQDVPVQTPLGPRTEKHGIPVGEIHLKGPRIGTGRDRNNLHPESDLTPILNHGVPRDLWEQWYSDNLRSDLIVNRVIFADSDASEVEAMVREVRDEQCGIHPIDPSGDPRVPKLVEQEEEQKKRLNIA